MKTELFGGSEDGKPIEIRGNVPSTIEISVVPDLIARLEDPNEDPRVMFKMETLIYKLDTDGRYRAEDMTK